MKNLKRTLKSLLILTMFGTSAFADGIDPIYKDGTIVQISGKIIDQNTGEPLTGVKVFYTGSEIAVYTDFDGEFTMEVPAKKGAELSVSLISYEMKTLKLENSKKMKVKLARQK